MDANPKALPRLLQEGVEDILTKDMVWIPVYNTKEIAVTRASVKGFTVHPVEYNLGLWKTWLDK